MARTSLRSVRSPFFGTVFVAVLSAAACADSNDDAGGAGGIGGSGPLATTSASTGQTTGASQSGASQSSGASVSGSGATGSGSGATTAATSTSASSSSTGLPIVAGYDPEVEPNDDFMSMGNALASGSLGFVGASANANDSDVFTFQGVAGESRHIAISDGMGGCPVVGTSLQVQLFSPDNQEIASRFDTCPVLDTDLDVANLPVSGTYKIRVTALAPVPFYVLEIGVIPVVCGNGVRQQGESCDDGNVLAGDGCDDTCQVELPGGACAEIEPNETPVDATSILGCAWGVGTSSSDADLDHYSFDVPADGYSARVEVHDVTGLGCPSTLYGALRLFNQANVEIAYTETFSDGECPALIPSEEAGATNLVTGKYKVGFEPGFGIPGGVPYALKVTVAAPGCGDSIIQAGEECDDGNVVSGDLCDSTCQWEGDVCGEVEPNDTQATANATAGCLFEAGETNPAGDADFFVVPITVPGSRVVIRTYGVGGVGCSPNGDPHIYFYDPSGALIVEDDDSSPDGFCSLIDATLYPEVSNLPAGNYAVSVREHGDDETDNPYFLSIIVQAPGCGDNILQPGEECDDGNVVAGDGCSDVCVVEGVFCTEAEPNNTQATATPLSNCSGRGSITPVGDVDRYSFVVPANNTTAVIEVSNGLSTCPNFDSFLRLYDASGVQLAFDDDSGPDICSRLTRAGLAAGTYTFEVSETGNNATQASYVVSVTLN